MPSVQALNIYSPPVTLATQTLPDGIKKDFFPKNYLKRGLGAK